MSTAGNDITLTGLKGSSLLGFMSALGTLQTLHLLPGVSGAKMKWITRGSSFVPVIRTDSFTNPEELVESLNTVLQSHAGHSTVTFADDLKVSGKVFRVMGSAQLEQYLDAGECLGAAVAAAFGSDAILNKEGNIEDTAFRTMSGAGHQHFLRFMNELSKGTNVTHLKEALFGPWQYKDPSPIMRWDDEDDRRYALRWDEPSKDPVRTVRGANRLAIAALPLFPVVPVTSSSVATTGFKGNRSHNTFVTWPIWSGWLGIDVIRSILAVNELQQADVDVPSLASRGIFAVYRSQRITLGKYRNFTPSKSM